MRESSCSDPANALLPWYVNGSLEAEEDAAVRAHLEGCSFCARELAELAGIAKSLSLHGMPEIEIEQAKQPERRPTRIAYFVAAALALPALLGLYWIYLGFPGRVAVREAPAARSLRATATLDLGAGPVRGDVAVPTLALSPGVSWVALSFLLPAVPETRLTAELEDSSGRVLAADEDVRPDEKLNCTYSLPADLLANPGEYAILLHEMGRKSPRSYRFPFRVELVPIR